MKLHTITEMQQLRQLCATIDPAKRIKLIISRLKGTPRIQNYQAHDKPYYNIYSYIDAGKETTIAITAHYDTAVRKYENCLDNNASVHNLINLHNLLIQHKELLKYNILVAFVDGEETVDFEICGIYHLVHNFDVDQLIDLELTASGNRIIMYKYGQFDLFDYPTYKFPFNNAAVADYWKSRNPNLKIKGSACLVTASDEDIKNLDKTGYCDRFMACHKAHDTIANWANKTDMDKLVQTLLEYLIITPGTENV